MKKPVGSVFAAPILIFVLAVIPAFGQGFADRLTHPDAVGGSLVGTHLDGLETMTSMGPGLEFFMRYNVSPRVFVSVGTGIGSIYDGMFAVDNFKQTLFPTLDLRVGVNLIENSSFTPFLYGGIQGFGWKADIAGFETDQEWDASVFGGGGIEYTFNDQWGFHFTGDYRYIFTTDANVNNAHWVAKMGVTYALQPRMTGPREEIEYPVGEGELALDDLFREIDATGDTTEDDALALLFAPETESDTGGTDELPSFDEIFEDISMPEESGTDVEAIQPVYADAEVNDLLQQIADLRDEMDRRMRQIESLQEQVRSNERSIAEVSGRMAGSLTGAGSFGVADASGFKQNYEAALQKFYSKQYQQAIREFSGLLATNPDHRLASNCQYWIGETYNAMGEYGQAVDAFNAVLRYKSSYKLDDALLMNGLCYLKLGDRATARENFQTLVSRYPDSEYAPKAMRYLGRL